MYGRFIQDFFGGFINLFAARFSGSEAESCIQPINSLHSADQQLHSAHELTAGRTDL